MSGRERILERIRLSLEGRDPAEHPGNFGGWRPTAPKGTPLDGFRALFEAAGGEVVVRNRKLIGSAMRAHAGAILQHGAIVLGWDGRLQAGSMGLKDDASLRARITTLRDEISHEVPRPVLERTLIEAFSSSLGAGFEQGQPTVVELNRQDELFRSLLVDG